MEAYKNFRPATRNRLTKIQKQNNPKTPRRLNGEMRVMRHSQARLNRSLEKLAVSLSNHRLLGKSASHFDCSKLRSLNANNNSEERRQNIGEPLIQKSYHGDLECANPLTNLKMIPETEYNI